MQKYSGLTKILLLLLLFLLLLSLLSININKSCEAFKCCFRIQMSTLWIKFWTKQPYSPLLMRRLWTLLKVSCRNLQNAVQKKWAKRSVFFSIKIIILQYLVCQNDFLMLNDFSVNFVMSRSIVNNMPNVELSDLITAFDWCVEIRPVIKLIFYHHVSKVIDWRQLKDWSWWFCFVCIFQSH